MCHSDTDPGTGDHTKHLTAAGSFGITIGCTDCHVTNVDPAHADTDGTVDFTAPFDGQYAQATGCGTKKTPPN